MIQLIPITEATDKKVTPINQVDCPFQAAMRQHSDAVILEISECAGVMLLKSQRFSQLLSGWALC